MPIRGAVRLENLYVQSVTLYPLRLWPRHFSSGGTKYWPAETGRVRHDVGTCWVRRRTDGRETPVHNRTCPMRIRADRGRRVLGRA